MTRLLLVVLVVLAPLGCAPPPQRLMPTPSVVRHGIVDPWSATPLDRRDAAGRVFIASNRAMVPSPETSATPFSNKRSHRLHLAVSDVEIGDGMGWDALVAASSSAQYHGRPTLDVVRTEVVGEFPAQRSPGFESVALPADAARWFEMLNTELASGAGRELFVFVHGFNTEFATNTGMAAEMWHYRGRRGAVMSFAWPSRYRVLGYGADKANAEYAVRHFRQLLAGLAEHTEAGRIHILAHSAGCPIVVDAMRELRLIDSDMSTQGVRAKYRIGRVVLAAPDMDLMRFFNARLDGFDDLAERLTVYASGEDDALRLSSLLFGDERLGDSVGRLTEWERQEVMGFTHMEIVDVTRPEDLLGEFLGHSYYHRDPWVSSDVWLMLEHGLPAEGRGLLRNAETGFWEFPADYLDRLVGLELPRSVPER